MIQKQINQIVGLKVAYSFGSVLDRLAKGASESAISEVDGAAAGAKGASDPRSVSTCSAVPEPLAVPRGSVDETSSSVCGAVTVLSAFDSRAIDPAARSSRCTARARDCRATVEDGAMVLAAMSLI